MHSPKRHLDRDASGRAGNTTPVQKQLMKPKRPHKISSSSTTGEGKKHVLPRSPQLGFPKVTGTKPDLPSTPLRGESEMTIQGRPRGTWCAFSKAQALREWEGKTPKQMEAFKLARWQPYAMQSFSERCPCATCQNGGLQECIDIYRTAIKQPSIGLRDIFEDCCPGTDGQECFSRQG